ncbi:MAG: hypothetical protein ABIK28_24605 [Planctomycetota bacterium]
MATSKKKKTTTKKITTKKTTEKKVSKKPVVAAKAQKSRTVVKSGQQAKALLTKAKTAGPADKAPAKAPAKNLAKAPEKAVPGKTAASRKEKVKKTAPLPESTSIKAQPIPAMGGDISASLKEELRSLLAPALNRINEMQTEMKGMRRDLSDLGRELGELKSFSTDPIPEDVNLADGVEPLRRFLNEWLEARMESVLGDLVMLRSRAGMSGSDSRELVAEIENLLERLGAVRYFAERLDQMDSLIHTVAEEQSVDDAPDGVILDTLRPGFRTARGIVLAKAHVAVNRREDSGSAGN